MYLRNAKDNYLRPVTMLKMKIAIARTSRVWISEPPMWLTSPIIQNKTKTDIMVYSISTNLRM